MIPATVWAEGNSRSAGTMDELKSALEAGGTVELTDTITSEQKVNITISKPVILDLKGNTVTSTYGSINNFIISIKEGGSLTVNDSLGGGKICATHSSNGYGIQLYSGGTFIMNGGTIETTQETIDIRTSATDVKIEINGGTLKSSADNVLGIRGKENIDVKITDGDLISNGRTGVYISGNQEGAINLDISGGTIKHSGGMSGAIQAYKGADVRVSGDAEIISESSSGIQVQENSSLSVEGGSITGTRGLQVEDNANIVVSGGAITATGRNSKAIDIDDSPTIALTGGTFKGKTDNLDEYIPSGMEMNDNGGIVAKQGAEAKVGTAVYETLGEAIEKAKPGDTITLLTDVAVDKQLELVEKVTLDLGKRTITASDSFTPTTGDGSHLIEILKDGVTIENGTVKTTKNNKHGIHVYRVENVKLEDMTIDHTNASEGAPIVVNGSNVTFEGVNNLITGPNSWYAMNVDSKVDGKNGKITIAEGAVVTLGEDGKGSISVESSKGTQSIDNKGTLEGNIIIGKTNNANPTVSNSGTINGNVAAIGDVTNSGTIVGEVTSKEGKIINSGKIDGEVSGAVVNTGTINHTHNYVNGVCSVCGAKKPSTGGGTVTPSVTKSRVAGDDRFETAIKVADKLKSELGVVKFNSIVVANSDEFADALSATALAADKNAPILVVNKNNESIVKTYIANNLVKGGNVYIIGGTAVVSESFEKSLTGCKVTRLGGSDRYETNLEVLKTLGVTGASDIMVASGLKYPDALSASATGNPVILVGKTLTDNQKAYLATLGGNDDYYVIGGTAAVNATVMNQLNASKLGTVTRLGGDTRYETGLAVADEFFTNARNVVIASGDDFPDGLTGGVLANAMNAPLMLVNQYNTDVAADYVDDNSVRTVIAIGGTTVIPDATLNKVA